MHRVSQKDITSPPPLFCLFLNKLSINLFVLHSVCYLVICVIVFFDFLSITILLFSKKYIIGIFYLTSFTFLFSLSLFFCQFVFCLCLFVSLSIWMFVCFYISQLPYSYGVLVLVLWSAYLQKSFTSFIFTVHRFTTQCFNN